MARINVIQPESLRQKVEDAVRDAITSGLYLPGERLIERVLCEELGVSRASVREALRKLEAEKLVEIIPHKGPIVSNISLEDARQLYALRAVLEGFSAREFALKASDEDIEDFAKAAKQLRQAVRSKRREEVLKAKTSLYDVMLSNCGNALVHEILKGMHSRINILRATSLVDADRLPRSLAEINALALAFRKRDADAAHEIAREHVINASEVALRYLEEQSAPQMN